MFQVEYSLLLLLLLIIHQCGLHLSPHVITWICGQMTDRMHPVPVRPVIIELVTSPDLQEHAGGPNLITRLSDVPRSSRLVHSR